MLLQVSVGKQWLRCHLKSLQLTVLLPTRCPATSQEPSQEGLWLVPGSKVARCSSPALCLAECGAVSICPATDVIPVRSLNKWLQSSTFSYRSQFLREEAAG